MNIVLKMLGTAIAKKLAKAAIEVLVANTKTKYDDQLLEKFKSYE